MRNPDRLDKFYADLKHIHKKYFPDWRFGQLCSNFFGWLASQNVDLFFPEEEAMMSYLRKYVKENNQWHHRWMLNDVEL